MDISIRHPQLYAIYFIYYLYLLYTTTFFKNCYCEVIAKRILIIFAQEEAEIVKDYYCSMIFS
jgi:hypothetical protein